MRRPGAQRQGVPQERTQDGQGEDRVVAICEALRGLDALAAAPGPDPSRIASSLVPQPPILLRFKAQRGPEASAGHRRAQRHLVLRQAFVVSQIGLDGRGGQGAEPQSLAA